MLHPSSADELCLLRPPRPRKPSSASYADQTLRFGQAFRLDLAYRGQGFAGFQSQANGQAVQDHVERALQTMLRHQVRVRGASRTDAGVHASGQVAVFRSHQPWSRRWLPAVNAILPAGIGVRALSPVDSEFDPIFDARAKAYRYRLWRGRCFDPFFQDFVWPLPYPIDLSLLIKCAEKFPGLHDFASFCNRDSDARTTVREIFETRVHDRGPLIDIWISGNGFLKQMIRIMVGTMVQVAGGRLPRDAISSALKICDRKAAGITAPPQGLTLVQIAFDVDCPSGLALDQLTDLSDSGFCLPVGSSNWPQPLVQ